MRFLKTTKDAQSVDQLTEDLDRRMGPVYFPLNDREEPYNVYFSYVFLDCTISLSTTPYFDFVFQYGPPGVYQPGQITNYSVLNVFGGLSNQQKYGFMMDKHKASTIAFS